MKKNLVNFDNKRQIYYKMENEKNNNTLSVKKKVDSVDGTGSSDKIAHEKVVGIEGKRKKPTEPFWDDGKSESSPKLPPVNRKKRNNPINQISLNFLRNIVFLSAIAAVLVGGAFGVMLLSLFSGGDPSTDTQEPSADVQQSQVQASGVMIEQEGKFSAPALDVQVVQGGAFTTAEKGNEMREMLTEQNLPSILAEENGTHYLFMGVAGEKAESEALAAHFQERDVETYLKPYAVYDQALEIDEPVFDFMNLGVQWMEQAMYLSVNDIAGVKPSDDEIARFFELGQEWQASVQNLESQDEEVGALMTNWLQSSQPVMGVYSTTASSSPYAWEVQQTVLEGMLYYDDILQQLQ